MDLEVYLDRTRLLGGQDACAFSKERLDWATAEDEDPTGTVVLGPGGRISDQARRKSDTLSRVMASSGEKPWPP